MATAKSNLRFIHLYYKEIKEYFPLDEVKEFEQLIQKTRESNQITALRCTMKDGREETLNNDEDYQKVLKNWTDETLELLVLKDEKRKNVVIYIACFIIEKRFQTCIYHSLKASSDDQIETPTPSKKIKLEQRKIKVTQRKIIVSVLFSKVKTYDQLLKRANQSNTIVGFINKKDNFHMKRDYDYQQMLNEFADDEKELDLEAIKTYCSSRNKS